MPLYWTKIIETGKVHKSKDLDMKKLISRKN
jgi:hypothetical protein